MLRRARTRRQLAIVTLATPWPVVGESASLSESLAEVEIVPRPERIPEEERNDEELLIDPDSEEEAELDSDDEVF